MSVKKIKMIAHEVVQSADLKAGDKVLEIGSYEPASDAQNRDSASECYDSAEMPRYYASGNAANNISEGMENNEHDEL
jgi:hypothetical protein